MDRHPRASAGRSQAFFEQGCSNIASTVKDAKNNHFGITDNECDTGTAFVAYDAKSRQNLGALGATFRKDLQAIDKLNYAFDIGIRYRSSSGFRNVC